MAKAYKCDICGRFYVGERTRQIVLGMTDPYVNEKSFRYHICSDCEQSFHLWKESRNANHKSAFEDKEDVNLFDGDIKRC